MHMAPNCKPNVHDDRRKFFLGIRNRRNRDKRRLNIHRSHNLGKLFTPIYPLCQLQRAIDGAVKETALYAKLIHDKSEIISCRLHAVKPHAPCQEVPACTHLTRAAAHDNGIAKCIDLHLHIRDGGFNGL